MSSLKHEPRNQNGILTLHPEKGEGISILSAALIAINILALLLRFWSRALSPERKPSSDDWLAAAALPFVISIQVRTCLLMRHGFGRHVDEVLGIAPNDLKFSLKVLYTAYLTYLFAISLIHISVGLSYKRLFGIAIEHFENQVRINTSLNVLYIIIMGFLSAFECSPVSAFWEKSISKATCRSTLSLQLGSVIPGVVLDLVVLLMPMPIIWKLQMSLGRKSLLEGTFFLGYSVVVISIGRLVTVSMFSRGLERDFTWNFVNALNWTDVEVSVASICISLPSYLSLVKRIQSGGFRSIFSTRRIPLRSGIDHRTRTSPILGGDDTHRLISLGEVPKAL